MERGFLLIADISGYTSYLSDSELEPAAEHLRFLLDMLIENTKPPLVISRLQGDAVISYAPEASFLHGQTLVEMVESTYVAFRRALDLAVINNDCGCHACRKILDLDLKFFVHYGSFLVQQLGTHSELVGADVNLVHRLAKNTIVEKTGIKAYIAYTEAAIRRLGIEELARSMVRHEEQYPDVGLVSVYVQDMHPVWEQQQAEVRSTVSPDDVLAVAERTFPVGRVLMWDYVTGPEYKAILSGSGSAQVSNRSHGRTGSGTVYRCSHGRSVSSETIADWQPFEQYTYESTRLWGQQGRTTVRITPTTNGTTVTVLAGKSLGEHGLLRDLHDLVYRPIASQHARRGLRKLEEQVAQELRGGKVVQPAPTVINIPELEREIIESLAR
jgi:hypothetical protein